MNEHGYSYIEFTITFSLLIFLIPALYFCSNILEQEFKKYMAQERLQMEFISFQMFVQNELKKGQDFSLRNGGLEIRLPTEVVRYEQKKREIIRSVKAPNEKQFKGYTILLQHVYLASFIPDQAGVTMEIGMQNWLASIDVTTYVGKRVVMKW